MTPWLTLVKKDLRMTRTQDLVALVGLVIIESLLVYLAYRTGNGVASVLTLMLIGLHLFYLPIHLFISLSREWRKTAPLWLHLPQSGWSLLSAKLISGLLMMLLSFVVTGAFSWWIFHIEVQTVFKHVYNVLHTPTHTFVEISLLGSLVLFWWSVTMAVWIAVISIAMQSVKNQLRGWRWVLGLAIVIFAIWAIGAFENTPVYHTLLSWGGFYVRITPTLGQTTPLGPIYTGEVLFNIAIVAAVFYVCGLLLDKRVEVASND